jgi:heparin lyase
MKYLRISFRFLAICFLTYGNNACQSTHEWNNKPTSEINETEKEGLAPLLQNRIHPESELATEETIIDKQWVAVGITKKYSIQHDYTISFEGQPSYRFQLKPEDNNLNGYAQGSTKGRTELSFAYATSDHFMHRSPTFLTQCQQIKSVYDYGKGACKQGSHMKYTFSIWVPKEQAGNAKTIFAQWHGMPDRTLTYSPTGITQEMNYSDFIELLKTTIFKKEKGYQRIYENGKATEKAGPLNGWRVEQGGYPPLAFGFSGDIGYENCFYIKCNSDKKWLSNNDDRVNANSYKSPIGKIVYSKDGSKNRSSVIAYRMPYTDFPKEQWVTFEIDIQWSKFTWGKDEMAQLGLLDIYMSYLIDGDTRHLRKHIVNQLKLPIGRNDKHGYYFKFGSYRTASSTINVCYNLAGFTQKEVH